MKVRVCSYAGWAESISAVSSSRDRQPRPPQAAVLRGSQGFYVYGFLDPGKGTGRLVGYVFGITAGIIVIFLVTMGVAWLRKWATERRMGMTGKFHAGRSLGHGDVELEAQRVWEK